jgi:hypothetical protein
MNGHV